MKISIITVTFNPGSVLVDCLASVSRQNYPSIEHIVIDGGSSDGTVELLGNWRGHLDAVISEPDQGIYDAMNKGLSFATGDVIGFLNSDDFYTGDDVLKTVAEIFSANECLEACYGDLEYVKAKKTGVIVRVWKSCQFAEGLFSEGWCPPHPTFFCASVSL